MSEVKLEKVLEQQDYRFLVPNTSSECDKLLRYLRGFSPMIGIADKRFCSYFMDESVELLKRAIFLFRDGYLDCAFYLARQSIENLNNMLYLSNDKEKLDKWKAKKAFPSDFKIKSILKETNRAYSEMKTQIPEIFDDYDVLLKKANKYIHKQGYDTFNINRWQKEKLKSEQIKLFVEFMKQSIGLLLLMNVILDPLALALADSEVDPYIHFDPLAEAIPIYIFDELFEYDIVSKIKQTEFYMNFTAPFKVQEKLNEATYNVIRCNYFDVNELDDIAKQIHILGIRAALCFSILNYETNILAFHFQDYPIPYRTSVEPRYQISNCISNKFGEYIAKDANKNIEWGKMYISVYKVFDDYIILEHNDQFDNRILESIQDIINSENQKYNELINKK